jgi:hypothetical protein
MKSVFLVLVLLALLAATLWWALYAWNSVDVEMSIHGYIAMILGIVFSLESKGRGDEGDKCIRANC